MFESLSALWYRIRSRFHRDELDAELADELRTHAEFLEDEARAAGASPDGARRAASDRLGNMTNIRERTRERWSFGWVEALLQDTRYAFRFLRRAPGFTAVAVLSLALGIGANATVFAVADKLLFSAPEHITNSDELLVISVRREYAGSKSKPFFAGMTLFSEFFALKEQAKSFADVALVTTSSRQRLGRGPLVPRIKESLVTANFFDILGVRPFRGRFLLPDDENAEQSEHAAVISYGFWRRHFGGADSAIGAHVALTDMRFVIVGIAPEHFTGADIDAVDVWVPMGGAAPQRVGSKWKTGAGGWPKMLVRLQPGVAVASAEAEATVILRRLPGDPESPSEETVALGSIIEARGPADQSPEVQVSTRLVVASVLVLLAACANLANLLLVRALTRRREIALRLAVGVTRGRLALQMLLEALIIAFAGSLAALAAAYWAGTALRKLVFPELQWGASAVNLRVFVFAVLCGAVVAVIATIAPAIRMTRADVATALRSAASQLSASTGRLRQGLMILQVALSVLLIVGAAAFSKSLNEAYRFDMGIDVDRIVTARFGFESDSLNAVSRRATLEEAARRARAIPGVELVTVASSLPLTGATNRLISIPERELPNKLYTISWEVTPELLPTMGFRLTRGRWFASSDVGGGLGAPVLLSETGARKLWPAEDPVGRCVRLGNGPAEACHPVVGIIKDLRARSLHDEAGISMLLGIQNPDLAGSFRGYVVIRTKPNVDMNTVVASSRAAFVDLRLDLSSITVEPLAKALESDYRPLRMGSATFGSFALLAIILSAIGLYGILAFSVAQRTNEFGIRSALGAQARDLVTSVVREGMLVVAVGVVLGMALSWYASSAIAALLFQSSARDAMPYVYAVVVLGVVAVGASIAPAWRATRVDPAIALRAE